jgi:hypothetical protein
MSKFFDTPTPELCELMEQNAKRLPFEAKQSLFDQCDPRPMIRIIDEGTGRVQDHALVRLSNGDVFEEVAELSGAGRMAIVAAEKERQSCFWQSEFCSARNENLSVLIKTLLCSPS